MRASTTLKFLHGLGIDVPLAADDGTSLSYFHADGLASIVKVTDASGAVTTTRQYDSWGNLEVGSSNSGYAFTARDWDPETGLYYYRARYYDPKAGRFISEDPIGFGGGDNFYAYVGNNPVTWVDPFGLMAGAMAVGMPTSFNPHDPGCVSQCVFDRVLIYVGIFGMGASQPVVAKPGGVAGGGPSGPVTSPASKVFRKCLPQKLPIRVLGTTTVGGVAARALPYVSAGLILWDVVGIMRCVDACPIRVVCPKLEGDGDCGL